MRTIAVAVLLATLSGCVVAPLGPPVYVEGAVGYRYPGAYARPYPRPYYGGPRGGYDR